MGDSVVELLRQKQQRAAELRQELTQIEAELAEARELLAAGKSQPSKARARRVPVGTAKRPIQSNSSVDWAKRVLDMVKTPLEVDDLLGKIRQIGGPQIQKPTLVSNLSRYVKQGNTFNRTAPNTYGLIEWDRAATDIFGERHGKRNELEEIPDVN